MWKKVLKDYQVALDDLDKVYIQWTKSALSLRTCAHEKKVFKEDGRPFEILDKHDVIKPSIAHILRIFINMSNKCWIIMKNLSRTLTRLMFLNQTMHSLWKLVENAKYMLHDYQRVALENIHKTHYLDSNDASILRTLEHVKTTLDDY
jgi:uncharacterized protein YutE (UPF0331/DUF86 family)